MNNLSFQGINSNMISFTMKIAAKNSFNKMRKYNVMTSLSNFEQTANVLERNVNHKTINMCTNYTNWSIVSIFMAR